jgi:cell division septation protein DedD
VPPTPTPSPTPDPEPRDRAAPPLGSGSLASVPSSSPAVRTAPKPPPVSAPRRVEGGHAIQVGAFGERSGAQGLVRELEAAGFPVYVIEDTGGSARFKVRVGPVAERSKAETLAAKLKRDHHLPTWILTRDAR